MKTKGSKRRPLECPNCGEHMHVQKTYEKKLRYYKCKDCGLKVMTIEHSDGERIIRTYREHGWRNQYLANLKEE